MFHLTWHLREKGGERDRERRGESEWEGAGFALAKIQEGGKYQKSPF